MIGAELNSLPLFPMPPWEKCETEGMYLGLAAEVSVGMVKTV